MTEYICRDTTSSSLWTTEGETCNCEYRDFNGQWQFRYRGPGSGQTNWVDIPEESLEEIRKLGHNPVVVDSL